MTLAVTPILVTTPTRRSRPLTSLEAGVLRSFREHPAYSGDELAHRLGRTQNGCRLALRRLIRWGLIPPPPGAHTRTGVYTPPAPEVPIDEVYARAAMVRAAAIAEFGGTISDDRRDEDHHDAIGCVGFGHAAPPPVTPEDHRAACRVYLREYRALRRRDRGIPTPPPRHEPATAHVIIHERERFYTGVADTGMGRPRASHADFTRLVSRKVLA